MSIALGMYDIFSYLIPGFLYLYVVNEFLKLIGWEFIDITQYNQGIAATPGITTVAVLIISVYLLGHVFEALRSLLLDKRFYHGAPERALEQIKSRLAYSNIKVNFHGSEWRFYQEILRVRNPQAILESERLKSIAFMMKNISACAFLYGVLQLIHFIKHATSPQYLYICLLAVALTLITYKRARLFDEITYRIVYDQALAYGSDLQEFLNNSTPSWKIGKASESKENRNSRASNSDVKVRKVSGKKK